MRCRDPAVPETAGSPAIRLPERELLAAVDKAIELHGREDPSMLRTKAVIFDGIGRHAEARRW